MAAVFAAAVSPVGTATAHQVRCKKLRSPRVRVWRSPSSLQDEIMTVIGNRKALAQDSEFRLSEASARDYFELLKPRVMSLVVFTAFAGLVLAPDHINPVLGLIAILCIAVGAGASGALNMWYDADIDAVMSRTAKRPIPAGRIKPKEALAFG